jgi:hypothetical protein
MADRNFPSHQICNFQRDGVLVCGHFSVTLGGAGPVTVGTRFGNGWTAVWTAAGRFTVTTDETFHHIVAFGTQFCAATPTDRFTTADVPTGGAGAQVVMEINLWDVSGAAVTDPAAATDEIHFWMLLSTSFADRSAW